MLHHLLVAPPVGLCAQGVNRRTLAEVQHAVLDAGLVRGLGHLAAERVELAHKVPLARTADGGVAGHVADAVEIHREAHGVKPHARRGKRGFDSCMPCADNGYIAFSRVIFYQSALPRFRVYKQKVF